MKSVQKNWARSAIRTLRQYPPEKESYKQTGELGRAWQIDGPHEERSGIITRIVNETKYAIFVYGDEVGDGQAWMHVGRWTTIPDAIDRDGYLDDLRQVMRGAVGS